MGRIKNYPSLIRKSPPEIFSSRRIFRPGWRPFLAALLFSLPASARFCGTTLVEAHPEAVAFQRAIAKDYWSDTPRLAYADWLREHGLAERAELIQLQVAESREHMPTQRIRELIDAHGESWLPEELVRITRTPGMSINFERGFATAIETTANALLVHASTLNQLADIRTLTIQGDVNIGALLANRATRRLLRNVNWLQLFRARQGNLALRTIVQSPDFRRLERLIFHDIVLTQGSLVTLQNSTLLPHLQQLFLNYAGIRAAGVRILANAPSLQNLTALGLVGSSIDSSGLDALLSSPHLRNVTHLAIDIPSPYTDSTQKINEFLERNRKQAEAKAARRARARISAGEKPK